MKSNNIDFFLNRRNIPNQNLVKNTISYFESGKGIGVFDKLEFLNLLWDKLEFIKTNRTNPQVVFDDLSNLQLNDNQRFTLLGFILSWYGGSPVSNMDKDTLRILEGIESKIKTDYNDGKYDKSFFTHKIESLISYMQSETCINYWENNKCGNFEFDKKTNLLYFREADTEYPHSYTEGNGDCEWIRNKKNHTIASGFIVHLLINLGDKCDVIYDNYYNKLQNLYSTSENKKPGAHKRNLKDEFYIKHISEEKERIENSIVLFDYLKEQDNQTIQSYIDDYFGYIKKEEPKQIGECTNGSEQSEVDDHQPQYKFYLKKDYENKVLKVYQFWNNQNNKIQGYQNIFANTTQADFLNMINNADFTTLYNTNKIKQRVGYTIVVLSNILGKQWGDKATQNLNVTIRKLQKNTRFNEYDALKEMFL